MGKYGQMGLLYEPAPFTCWILLAERGVGQRRIGREGVILVAGLRSDAVLAAELERVEPLVVAGEGFLQARPGVNGPRLRFRGQRAFLRVEAARLHPSR